MQAYAEFRNMDPSFWAMVKFVSESLGYTVRGKGIVCTYSIKEIQHLFHKNNLLINLEFAERLEQYFAMRAETLNNNIQYWLMDAESARAEFDKLYPLHVDGQYLCKLPLNKQKGDMKKVAYFTGIVNILAEKAFRESRHYNGTIGFNNDPRG